MALTATTQILYEDKKRAIVKCTGYSDGTGESGIAKVTLAGLANSPTSVKLMRLQANLTGLQIRLFWGGTPNSTICLLGPGSTNLDCYEFGGIANNASTPTYSILFFTEATPGITFAAGAAYSVIIHVRKFYS